MGNKGTCKAASCDKDVRAKGYCDRHYREWRKGKLPKPRYKSCNHEGCRTSRRRSPRRRPKPPPRLPPPEAPATRRRPAGSSQAWRPSPAN